METGVVIIQEPVLKKVIEQETATHSEWNKERERSELEKREAIKTNSVVEDSKIVKEKASETDDSEIVLSDVISEKEIEDDLTRKQEEVSIEKPIIEEDQTETKHSPEQEEKISTNSKVLNDTAPVKVDEDNVKKSLLSTDQIKEEKDSRTVETSVNGTEAEHNATVSVEDIPRNSENIVKETAPEETTTTTTTTNAETAEKALFEEEKDAEPRPDAKEKDETEIVSNEETTSHQSEILKGDDRQKETAEPVETIKNSDDSGQVSSEVTVDHKEEDTNRKKEEVLGSLTVTETPTIQGEDTALKALKDNEEPEHVLVRDIPQAETSTVQESAILKTLETKTDETAAEPSLDLKDDKEHEEAETVKTIVSSEEVQESIPVIKPPQVSPKELEEEEDQSSKDTEGDEHVLGRNMPQSEIFVTKAETLETKEDTEPIMDLKEDKEQEKTEKLEEIPSDLALKVDKTELKDEKIKVDKVDGAQTMEQQRGLDVNESEAEPIDGNRTDETEESQVEKLVSLPDVSEAKSKDVALHQEDQEEGSYGFETKGSELGEKLVMEERSVTDLTPLQEESCLRNMQENETKVEKEKIDKHELANEEVSNDQQSLLEENSDEVSSAAPSGEAVVETKKIEDIKANEEEEQVGDKIQKTVETVKTVDVEPVKFNEDEIEESSNSTREQIQKKSVDKENVPIGETNEVNEEKASRTAETSVNGTEVEHNAAVSVEEISKNTVNETTPERVEAIKSSDDAEKISHEVSGDKKKEEDITRKTKEVQESPTVISIQGENIDLKASKDTEDHEHVLVRDMPQFETLVIEAEAVDASKVQEAAISKTLETTTNETDAGQETKEDKEPSLDLTEEVEDDETMVDKVDGTQTTEEQRGLDLYEPEAGQIDLNRTDETEESQVEKLVSLPDVESVEKMQKPSPESHSEVSEETSTTVDEKIEEKPQGEDLTLHQESQEEASYGLETKEETPLVAESSGLGVKAQEEESCLPKETELQKERTEKHEPINEVPNDQHSLVEEKSEYIEDIEAKEEEEVADKIQKSLETIEIAEPHSSLPLYSEEQDHEAASEKIDDKKVKEEEPIVQTLSEEDVTKSHERQEEVSKTGDTTVVKEEQTQAVEKVKDEQKNVTSTTNGEKKANESATEAETVDASTVQDAAILKTLENTTNESEAVHSPIGGEEEDIKSSLDLKEDKEQEETETVKTVILSDEVRSSESQGREESVEVKPKEIVQDESTHEKVENLLDVPSLEPSSKVSEETSKAVDEKINEKLEEEVTLHQEGQEEGPGGLETKEETISFPQSTELREKSQEEDSYPSNEQEKETKLQDEQIEKHESASEEDTNAHQTPVEENSDKVTQVSSETVVEAEKIEKSLETVETDEPHSSFPSSPEEHGSVAKCEKIEDGKEKETEPMGDMTEKGPDISGTRDLKSRSHGTESSELVTEFEEQKPKQVKEVLEGERKEVDETKAERLPSSENIPQEALSDVVALQTKREDDGTESHERQEDLSKAVETKETMVAQEDHTRDIGTSLTEKGSMNQTQQEKQVNEECSRYEKEEVSLTEKEQTEKEDDKHVDSSEKYDSETQLAETKKEDEDRTVVLDGSGTSKTSENVCIKEEEFENLEAPKLEESKENKSHEISGTIKAIEAKGDQSLAVETPEANQTPSFVSELEDKIPKQIEDIHEEETKETQDLQVVVDRNLPVETSQKEQTPTLISEHDELQTSKKVEEIHQEETKAHKLQEEENLPTEIVPREFREDSVSTLASGEDDQVTVQEGDCAGDKKEEKDVSAETKESGGETKPKEPEVERAENSDDQIETSTKVTKLEDEDTKTTDTELPQYLENACLKQEESKELGDETSSTLPVVGILKELQNTLETEREVNDSSPLGEKKIIEPTEQLQETDDADAESSVNDLHSCKAEPETLEKNLVTDMSEPVSEEKNDKKVMEESSASEIIEANMLQLDETGEAEKIQEEDILAGKPLPVEEFKLQEEHKEAEKVQDGISREFEVIVEDKLKDETKEIAECKEETPAGLVVTSEKQITVPPSEAEKESNEEHVESQAILDDTKRNNEEVNADKSLTKEALDKLQVPSSAELKPSELITSENVQVQDQSKEFEQEKKSSGLTHVQEDSGKNAKLEVLDDEIRGDGHDSVVTRKEETGSTEEKREADYVNTEPEDDIKHGVSAEERNNSCEKTDREATEDKYQEKTAIKEEIKEEEKETTQESFNSMKNTDDATEKTKPEILETENLSSVSDNTQDKSLKQKDEVPNQQKDDDVPKVENLKIAEELQQKDGEFDKNKEPEPTVKEPARKSLSDLIQKVKGTSNIEDNTTKPHIEEDPKTEEEDEDEDEHKDDKTSPDSIVMVEAKDTVSITKTNNKKSQGILSGVGSKVKHSISKVKKALTGKSSQSTKQSL
ncbi:hypothetical protein EUTSA_v10027617mg [Eutrema salsugineum]|uniref:Uncharacterized protein n=1 Tax=Eutrema salsugineum TaxID=72664 RepID=V4L955_EUTSA|nr:hypothetical protein EUTSA_v10027617mg [Eutrema salsugineum]